MKTFIVGRTVQYKLMFAVDFKYSGRALKIRKCVVANRVNIFKVNI